MKPPDVSQPRQPRFPDHSIWRRQKKGHRWPEDSPGTVFLTAEEAVEYGLIDGVLAPPEKAEEG